MRTCYMNFDVFSRDDPKVSTLQSGIANIILVENFEDLYLTLQKVDNEIVNFVRNVLLINKSFKCEKEQVLSIALPPSLQAPLDKGIRELVLIGTGPKKQISPQTFYAIGASITAEMNNKGLEEATIYVEKLCDIEEQQIAYNLAIGIALKSYRFNRYRTIKRESLENSLKKVSIVVHDKKLLADTLVNIDAVVAAVFTTQDLVSEPANELSPAIFSEKCVILSELGVKVTVLNPQELHQLQMRALLGVAQGSINEPRVVVMEWKGIEDSTQPIIFIGKGVTFDSGGISIKPSNGMAEMKSDMAGAAVVVGLIQLLATRKAKAHVICIVGLVENMPSGSAQRPGDIVVSMSGQTIEIDNTDAEGRLVLVDLLCYAQQFYNPKIIVDLATLTGAITVALGDGYAGLFANDTELAEKLQDAGEITGENLWRLPLGDHYDSQINSEIADVKNTGSSRGGGSITAAQFLQRFVKNHKWAHIDIAGVACVKHNTKFGIKGATGFGVRLLDQFLAKFYE